MPHAGGPEQAAAQDHVPHHPAGSGWQFPDLPAPFPGYAFAQAPDTAPPKFASSGLDISTGVLDITFSEAIDVTPATRVDASKIHLRESGNYTHGVTLTAAELGTTADGATVSFTLATQHRAEVARMAAPQLTIDPGAVQDVAGNVIGSTFDISTASFVAAITIPSPADTPAGMAFSNNGTKIFFTDSPNIHEYAMPNAFDVSTISHVATNGSRILTAPEDVAFSNDGTKMFVADDISEDLIIEFNLPVPFNITTASRVGSHEITLQEPSPTGMAFSNDGTRMFVTGWGNGNVNEYALPNAFDLTGASFTAAFDISTQDGTPDGIAFSNDGTKMFVAGYTNGNINEYALPNAFDLTGASFTAAFDVSPKESSPTDVAFSNDGTKMFVVGDDSRNINEYALSSVYPVAVTGQADTGAFVTTWRTTGANEAITIPATGTYDIDWGDGNTNSSVTGSQTHTYAAAGDHTVSILGGLERINLDSGTSALKLRSIDQWGGISWASMENAFKGARNMVYKATDAPDLSGVQDMSNMFENARAFNGDLSSWNVSGVTYMSGMFSQAYDFNQPLNDWDVSSVTTMSWMFYNALSFNQTLNDWDVSSVIFMNRMFDSAGAFDKPLNNWNVSKVTYMNRMFFGADDFNQPLNNWNVSKVTDMSSMFFSADAFNQPLNDWNVSKVTDMSRMFFSADAFNQPLSNWNVSGVTDMGRMFDGATLFHQNLGEWYIVLDGTSISSATETLAIMAQNGILRGQNPAYALGSGGDSDMFMISSGSLGLNQTVDYYGRTAYSVNITSTGAFGTGNHRMIDITVDEMRDLAGDFVTTWNTSAANQAVTIPVRSGPTYDYTVIWGDGLLDRGVTDNAVHTYADAGGHQVRIYGTYPGIHLNSHAGAPKLVSIDQWGSNAWTSMNGAFAGATAMTYAATDAPDLSGVQDMNGMFESARAFNGDLSSWNVSGVTDMSHMFSGARAFNQPLNDWDVSSVTTMSWMFFGATDFNRPLNDWNVLKVTYMGSMFDSASDFDRPLNDWNVSHVTSMARMFDQATDFNGNISKWNVSKVTNMARMFNGADDFNQPLNDWNVSKVTNMARMFNGADDFNQPLNDWNVSGVTEMARMFSSADDFNQPLNDWNVSKVTDMDHMFDGATLFQQNLGNWYVVANATSIARTDVPGVVAEFSAQNAKLGAHSPTYGNGTGGDWTYFEIAGNLLNMTSTATKGTYRVNVTASGQDVFESGNNWRVLKITLTGSANTAPTVDAGTDQTVGEGDTVTLSGGATDPDQGDSVESYTWSAPAGSGITFDDSASATPTFTAPAVASDTVFALTLTASDGTDSGMDSVDVTVKETSGAFITTWRTTTANESVTIPGTGTYSVVWGDGLADTGVSGSATHTYTTPGDHTISITGGLQSIRNSADYTNAAKMLSIDQWGSIRWTGMTSAFEGASNMVYKATDAPDLSGVQDMSNMFRRAASFDGDISNWNVSSVTNMEGMFREAASFNQTLNDWDVSSVINMQRVFHGAASFDGDISNWNVSSVTSMRSMFSSAHAFNQHLNDWNVSSVTSMRSMFSSAHAFNQHLNDWNVSSVTDMFGMFDGASIFDQHLNGWNVSKVTDMDNMFSNADAFDKPLNDWNVSKVTDMYRMFFGADAFNQPLNDWDVSKVTDMSQMFDDATLFHQNLGEWYIVLDGTSISSATETLDIMAQNDILGGQNPAYALGDGGDSDMFMVSGDSLGLNQTVDYSAKTAYSVSITSTGAFGTGNHRMIDITVDEMRDLAGDFVTTWSTSAANQAVTIPVRSGPTYDYTVIWGDGLLDRGVTGNAVHTYADAGGHQVRIYGTYPGIHLNFHADAPKLVSIDQWGSNAWTSMNGAFAGATAMTYAATDAPDLSGVQDMSNMFENAIAFNGDLSSWNVSGVTDMSDMFSQAYDFNQPLNDWNVSSVTDMSWMFYLADSFNRPLNDWDVSHVTSMTRMFDQATVFNGDISKWNVSKVTNMARMFYLADSFNQTLNGWNVSKVTDMDRMFLSANSFNQPLNGWNVSKVTDMGSMFFSADAFNRPLNGWNVSGVTDMERMFDGATLFHQNLGNWYVVANATSIARTDVPGVVAELSAQNAKLGAHSPAYGNGTGGDWTYFEIAGNLLNMTSAATKGTYRVNVTASGPDVFESGNNWRVLEITLTGSANTAPTVDAGTDQTVGEGDTVTLSGGATDPDQGDSVESYTWSAPAGSGITFDDSTSATPTFTAPAVTADTTFTLTLTASDGTDSGVDSVNVTVKETSGAFITTWRTTTANEPVTIPGSGTYSVVWGDGLADTGVSGSTTHTYTTPGDHTVSISGGLEAISLAADPANAAKLRSIDQWGDMEWTTMSQAFEGATNMVYNATDAPDLSGVTRISSMFDGAAAFDGNLSSWNVSSVTQMNSMFSDATSFDGDISSWNVSSVKGMASMFRYATSFDGDISRWDVSSVTGMGSMFNDATSFEGNLSSWNVSSVATMSGMFSDATSFDSDISGWDVSSALYIGQMFDGATSFNQPIGSWDVSSARIMNHMFRDATSFQQNLGGWYIVLDDVTISNATETLAIGAQNGVLRSQNPMYGLGSGGDSGMFMISSGSLGLKAAADYSAKTEYVVNVTSTGLFGTNNWRMVDVTVTDAPNQPPTVTDITGASSINEGASGTLTGTATDGDGTVSSYLWSVNNTSAVTITTGNAATLQYTASQVTSNTAVRFTLTVTDDDGATGSDTYDVTVTNVVANQPPTVTDITGASSINEGASGTLTGTATDGDGTVSSYLWSVNNTSAVTITTGNAATLQYTASQVTSNTAVRFTLTVTDDDGATGSDTYDVTVTNVVANQPPTVTDITGASSINEGASGTLTGTATDGDGTVSSYLWSVNNTSAVTITTGNAATLQYTASQVTSNTAVRFTLTVTDDDGATGSDTYDVTVTNVVANQPPTVTDITGASSINEGASGTLTGTATDGDGTVSSYLWSVNNTSAVTITTGNAATLQYTASQVTSNTAVRFTLTVTDDDGATGSDTYDVTVTNVVANQPPTVTDITGASSINEGASGTLTGTATDGDGTVSSYLWSVNNTSAVTITTGNAATLQYTASQVTSNTAVRFTLTVTDDDGATGSDTYDVTVTNVVANQPPTVTDITGASSINEGASGTLTGTATDGDGTVSSYLWSVNNTSAVTITTGNAATLQYTASQVTSNTAVRFTLTVTDDDGATGSDTYDVTVTNVVANQPPTVTDITGASSINEGASGTLTGTATDGDGTVSSYLWSVNNTSAVTITTGNAATLQYTASQVTSNTAVRFTLTVTDDDGATGSDTYDVTVTNVVANQPPTVTDITGASSINEGASGTLTGTATDGDGTVSSYLWSVNNTSAVTITTGNAATLQYTASQVTSNTAVRFTLTVTDDDGATGSDTYDVTVTNVVQGNRPPVLNAIPPQSGDELTRITFTATADDPDGDPLSFSLQGTIPAGASITRGGSFSWTPSTDQAGIMHNIIVAVSDGRGGTDTVTVTVTVNDVEPLPVSARSSGSSITLTMSEAVTSSGTGPNGFSVAGGGDSVSVDSITGSGTKSLVLGLSGPVSAPATLSYSGSGDVEDSNRTPLGQFSGLTISFQSKSKSAAQPPAITIGSQGHPQPAAPKSDGPLAPVPADGTPYPLTIGKNGYPLNSQASTVVPTQVAAGQPVTISVTVYDPTPIGYFAIYLNLQGSEISHLQSDTRTVWDSGDVRVTDPDNLMRNATLTLSGDPGDPARKTFTLAVSFSDSMGETNMVIRTWNAAGKITEVRIFDAIAVTPPGVVDPEPGAEPEAVDPEPVAPSVLTDPEPVGDANAVRSLLAVRMWSGFEPESITDAEMLALLGLDHPEADIPTWVMTNLGVLVAKGDVTVEQFVTALEYVLGNA